jgi:acetylornithine deacetylase
MTSLEPVEQLLVDFLATPSVSGNEGIFAETLCKLLERHFSITRIPVDETRFCVLATKGIPTKLLVAHIDTVVGEVSVRVEDEYIFGRGSCDNKGSLAAMICALKESAIQGRENIGLLCTVGEETTFDGAKAAAAWFKSNGIAPIETIIGEPTHLQAVTSQRGVLSIEIQCEGIQEHSSTEHPNSAIHKLVDILHQLQAFTLPDTTVNVGLISGGKAENIVAGSAQGTIVWRSLLPDIRARIEAKLDSIGIPHTRTIRKELAPVDHTSARFPKHAVSYFTEMFFFENSVVLGPGGIEDAHTLNEKVSRKELRKAVGIYQDFLLTVK